jgi:hypothetical protein
MNQTSIKTINQLPLLGRGTNKIVISVPKFVNLRIILQNIQLSFSLGVNQLSRSSLVSPDVC